MPVRIRMEQAVARAVAGATDTGDAYTRALARIGAGIEWPLRGRVGARRLRSRRACAAWRSGQPTRRSRGVRGGDTRDDAARAARACPAASGRAGHATLDRRRGDATTACPGAPPRRRRACTPRSASRCAASAGCVGVGRALRRHAARARRRARRGARGRRRASSASSSSAAAPRTRGDASEQRYRATLQAALDCVVTMDHRGRVVEFNPAAERTFGYAREAAVGREMAELIVPPDLREQHRAGLARYLAGGAPRVLDRRFEIEAMRADGTRFPVELAITRIDVPGDARVHRLPARHHRAPLGRGRAARVARADRRGGRRGAAADRARSPRRRAAAAGERRDQPARRARPASTSDPAAARELLDEAHRRTSPQGLAELRELARGIHPAVLIEGGLDPALRGLVRRSAVPARLVAVPPERLPAAVEAAAYFVVAEALTNVARHAPDATLRRDRRRAPATGGSSSRSATTRAAARTPPAAACAGWPTGSPRSTAACEVLSPAGGGTTMHAEIPCAS